MIKFVKSNAVAIKENNDLDEVSEDEFIRMARWLGYR